MKDNTPKNIKIGPIDYTVHKLSVKDNSQYGVCLYRHQRIYITPNMTHQQASDTLLHEVLHAIWNEAGLDHIPDLNEETIVRTIATWLRAVIVDNPDFVEFITDAQTLWGHKPAGNPDKEAAWMFSPKSVDEEEDE